MNSYRKEKINSLNYIFPPDGKMGVHSGKSKTSSKGSMRNQQGCKSQGDRSLPRSTVPKFINFLLPSKIEILSTKLKLMACIMLIST